MKIAYADQPYPGCASEKARRLIAMYGDAVREARFPHEGDEAETERMMRDILLAYIAKLEAVAVWARRARVLEDRDVTWEDLVDALAALDA